ncbi:hypothetical protein [Chitinimonas koreensis]|nr:hypothetical protein [Chitinimonas koreensis]
MDAGASALRPWELLTLDITDNGSLGGDPFSRAREKVARKAG